MNRVIETATANNFRQDNDAGGREINERKITNTKNNFQ